MIELLMATALMSIAILALLGVFPVMTDLRRNTLQNSLALYDAEQVMDSLLQRNQFIGTTPSTQAFVNGNFQAISPPVNFPQATMQYWGDPVYANGLEQMVHVQISWPDRYGVHSLQLDSTVSPNL
ncbi:MAG: type IV pilus modification PilV family protein [Candidatus Xenobia bacterium]